MALNLWKLGGQPTSYKPLPIGWNNQILIGLQDYKVTFKAKSPSGSVLWVCDDGLTDLDKRITLTNVFQSYEYIFTSKTHNQKLFFRDDLVRGDIIIEDIQLVQKPLPKLTQLNKKPMRYAPKAENGQVFNGQTDYFQLPSMTMDSIEIDCLIDSKNSGWEYIFDGRNGLANGYVALSTGNLSVGNGISTVVGFKKGERTKIKITAVNSFTDDVRLFAFGNGTAIDFMKGTLYKVTCYLGNQVVGQYDFENPSNIVGDKVIPNAKNLIPNFEDAQWSFDLSDKVLGKDVLVGNSAFKTINLILKPNVTYKMGITMNANRMLLRHFNSTGGMISENLLLSSGFLDATIPNNTSYSRVYLYNTTTGTFDFIKPQLYELSGKEGTIVGKPTPLRKASKRTLYSKR